MENAFWHWWQHLPELISPFIIDIGGIQIRYYGMMYIVAFLVIYNLALWRLRREEGFHISKEQLEAVMTAALLGLLIGGRVGYAIFYNFSFFVSHPIEAVLPFTSQSGARINAIAGMSYHGGLIGAVLGLCIYCRKNDLSFFDVTDLVCPVIPLGYTFGRVGNFLNGELYGRVTTSSIGMVFPLAPDAELRHPTQLYEAFFEGIVLFLVLFGLRKIFASRGKMFGIYLIGYGVVRFFIEYVREPDAHLGFMLPNLTMGQLLCAGMILSGIYLFYFLKIHNARRYLNENWKKYQSHIH